MVRANPVWVVAGDALVLQKSKLVEGGLQAAFEIGFVAIHILRLVGGLEPMGPDERELTIVEHICEALVEMGGKFVLPFVFKNAKGTRTKHHLIFVSKHHLGYDIMKQVMAKESSSHEQGVPTFEYSPATEKQPMLFELSRPLDALEEMLLKEYAGQTLTMRQIYDKHNYGRRYHQ